MMKPFSLTSWKFNLVGENTKENVLPKEMSFQIEYKAPIQEECGWIFVDF